MNHFLRALVAFIGMPIGLAALLLLASWLAGDSRRVAQWYDPWIGGTCLVIMLAALAWFITE